MGLPDNAHITLAELKEFLPRQGVAQDSVAERAIGRASAVIDGEGLGNRRTVYRGPVESATSIVNAAAAVASGNLALVGGAWANAAGRTLVVTINDPDRGLTGTLTITGTAIGGAAQTETFDLSQGSVLHGVKFFATVTQAACDADGVNAGDTISVGTSEGYTEFYSPTFGSVRAGCGYPYLGTPLGPIEIRPLEWPLRAAIIHEDTARVFGSNTLLVEGTDYELRNRGGVRRSIARLSGGLDSQWPAGSRVVRGRIIGGYKGPAEVPIKIKGVCLELASWLVTRKEFGLTSVSDGMGNRSFSGPPILTAGMKADLGEFYRSEVYPTAERGWSEVAA